MAVSRKSNRFKSVVHLGLFAIIVLLLFLNFGSNYITYHVWQTHQKQTALTMNHLAVEISRQLEPDAEGLIDRLTATQLKQTFALESIVHLPSIPVSDDRSTRWHWYLESAGKLAPSELTSLTPVILNANPNQLIGGEDDIYYLTYIYNTEIGRNLLVLAKRFPTLSYLDKTSQRMLVFNIVALVIVVGLYLCLWHYIMTPFKTMQLASEEAGRAFLDDSDDAESVVDEYRTMIRELHEKESRLIEMNEIISNKAEQLEQFNAHLLTSVNSGVISVDASGKINFFNPSASEMLRVAPVEVLDQPLSEKLPIDESLLKPICEAFASNQSCDYSEIDAMTGGLKKRIGMTISAIFNEQRLFAGITAILVDTTELHHLRSSLEIKERLSALGEMAGGLAHQLRNSVGAMLGFNRLIQRKLTVEAIPSEWSEAIEQEGREAEEMIEKFLGFARPFDYQPNSELLADILRDICDTISAKDSSAKHEISVNVPEELRLDCDRLLLKQAIGNIVDNAIAAYDGIAGWVEITATKVSHRSVEIRIKDRAGGIAEELQSRIFTPFVSSRPGGTGLGLPLAARIISLHGGRLSLIESGPELTVFEINLPLKTEKNKAVSTESVPG